MPFIVTYASAGCLPDYTSEEFDEYEDAAAHAYNEWCAVADGVLKEAGIASVPSEDHPLRDIADLYERGEYDHVEEAGGADDPREGSLYRWTICETD